MSEHQELLDKIDELKGEVEGLRRDAQTPRIIPMPCNHPIDYRWQPYYVGDYSPYTQPWYPGTVWTSTDTYTSLASRAH